MNWSIVWVIMRWRGGGGGGYPQNAGVLVVLVLFGVVGDKPTLLQIIDFQRIRQVIIFHSDDQVFWHMCITGQRCANSCRSIILKYLIRDHCFLWINFTGLGWHLGAFREIIKSFSWMEASWTSGSQLWWQDDFILRQPPVLLCAVLFVQCYWWQDNINAHTIT